MIPLIDRIRYAAELAREVGLNPSFSDLVVLANDQTNAAIFGEKRFAETSRVAEIPTSVVVRVTVRNCRLRLSVWPKYREVSLWAKATAIVCEEDGVARLVGAPEEVAVGQSMTDAVAAAIKGSGADVTVDEIMALIPSLPVSPEKSSAE